MVINKEFIESILKDNPQGLTIQDISNRLEVNRIVVTPLLSELKGEGKITIREVGQAKLHYWVFEENEDGI